MTLFVHCLTEDPWYPSRSPDVDWLSKLTSFNVHGINLFTLTCCLFNSRLSLIKVPWLDKDIQRKKIGLLYQDAGDSMTLDIFPSDQ